MCPPTPPESQDLLRAEARIPEFRRLARRRIRRRRLMGGGVGALLIGLAAFLLVELLPTQATTVHVLSPVGTSTTVARPATTVAPMATTTEPTTSTGTPTTTVPASATSTAPTHMRTVLAPQTAPPVGDECSVTLIYDADGNVQPRLCQNGGVNIPAWSHYAKGTLTNGGTYWSQTMSLGLQATQPQVLQAMCTDYARMYRTGPLTESAEQLAAAYNGWIFSDAVRTAFRNSNCHA